MRGQSGMPGNEYADGMVEHDGDVGKLLKALDDLGIANNTIVVYTTDNGPNQFSWPDAATTPFRSEKDTNWEGAFRVPAMIRWPGRIKPGEVSNEIVSGLDWFPTLLAAAGDTRSRSGCSMGANIGGKTFKVHLDGYNQLALPDRAAAEVRAQRVLLFQRRRRMWSPIATTTGRSCFASSASQAASRCGQIRSPACVRRRSSTCAWIPIERADIVSDQYYDWLVKNAYLLQYGVWRVAPFLQTFKDYPPSQRPASFSIDQMVDALMKSISK